MVVAAVAAAVGTAGAAVVDVSAAAIEVVAMVRTSKMLPLATACRAG